MKDSSNSAEIKFSTQASHESPIDQQNERSEVLGSSNNSRKITREDIEVVQNLIERCLQLYMNRSEVVNILLNQARIEPGFTTLVWQKLEEENADFFKAYYARLMLKKQITVFNQLLEHQYYLMKSSAPPRVPLAPVQNGIQHMSVNNVPMGYSMLHQPPMPSMGLPQIDVVNGIPASGLLHPMQMNYGKETVINRGSAELVSAVPAIKSEVTLSPASATANGQYPFTSTEISDLGMNALALDSVYTSQVRSPEALPVGPNCGTYSSKESLQPLCHIPWNFSFSDLAADFITAEVDRAQLGNYAGSDILLDSPEQNDIVEEFFVDAVPAPNARTEEKS
ncbi:uncharacterized protein LOC8274376 isoform X2 [Ricinus communis]|uniref:uncharacterized protein LOC8274376 isoform X2 n=1 Tax=Ricinus communis TaxID=3988 RepID=UPI00201B2F46|nr:uncharacterized protein LOC8274376 isoform X2 [Ricinus communis]XP_048228460.1 uncharacterized protein LOC8274376 isoform X2 [Ricinus communis]